MAVRVRLLSYRLSETTSILLVVVTPAPMVPRVPLQGRGGVFPFQDGGNVKPNEDQTFTFYEFFDETEENVYVCENTTRGMLTMLLDGCNCSVLACISTGIDKAFALLGSEECPGVVSLMASELYQRAPKLLPQGQTCDVAVACLEVYNKVVRHLLCLDPPKDIAILNLTIHKVKEAGTLLEPIMKGKNRTQHATDADAESSWSHAIFESYVTVMETATSTSKETRISMCSVDLAGSEHAAASRRDTKDQMREGTKLNLSLLVLGNCIDAHSKKGTKQVMYQDSKLTHILKSPLGG
ncbi:kinesin-like protein KIF18B [Dermacentor silvarum]|uniref:kinesin-like protein KIF18B n=1 Tax=Dermacentor silvarum TaxID=543639 RepID=UPI00189B1AE5|nr:kinesin-like protein KIF18B [Dermacentor silvarum]